MVAHSLIISLRRQRQGELYEFEASLVYLGSSKTGYLVKPYLKKERKEEERKERKKSSYKSHKTESYRMKFPSQAARHSYE